MNRFSFIIGLFLLFIISCNSPKEQMQTTKSGIRFEHVVKKEGAKAVLNDVLTMNMKLIAKKNGQDTLLRDTRNEPDAYMFQLLDQKGYELLSEPLLNTTIGDQVKVWASVDSIFRPEVIQQLGLTNGTDVCFELEILKIQKEAEARAERQKLMTERAEKQKSVDDSVLQAYFSANNIKPEKTASGLYYTITKQGTGANPKSNQEVTVHYTGKLLDGKKFDSSVDRQDPFKFPLGVGQVIPGWDEGIALLNKGAKATLYIPSTLAYGEQGAGGLIQPNTCLMFEVELISFK